MSEVGIRVNVRCNVNEENYPRLARYLQDMEQSVTHKENVSLGFSLLFDVRQGENDLAMSQKLLPLLEKIEASGFRPAPFLPLRTRFAAFHCMADRGSAVINPDGNLYACEHYPPESRFGDIWNGVTDEAAQKAFCRMDRTREKCRKCPFLPDCTSFVSCPVVDRHCREVYTLCTEHFLRQLVDKKLKENEEDVTPIC